MYLVLTSLSVLFGIVVVVVDAQTYFEPGGAKMVYGRKYPEYV